jgi:hypothetical protein
MGAWQRWSDRIYVGWGFVIFGFFFSAAFVLIDILTRHPDWPTTTGELVDIRNKSCDDRGCSMEVLMSFALPDGRQQQTWIYESEGRIYEDIPILSQVDEAKTFVGAKLKLHYDPRKPERASLLLRGNAGAWIVGAISASVLIPLGLGILYGPIRNSLRRRRLAKSGQRFEAEIGRIRQNKHHMRRSGEYSTTYYPWVITATWVHPQTGTKYQIESGPIWDDPRDDVNSGGRIAVTVDISRRPYLYAIDSEPLGEAPTVKVLSELRA